MLVPFATTSRLTPIYQVSPLYCRTPPAHRCPQRQRRRRRQRQRVTEGNAMAPWNGPNDANEDKLTAVGGKLFQTFTVSSLKKSFRVLTEQRMSPVSGVAVRDDVSVNVEHPVDDFHHHRCYLHIVYSIASTHQSVLLIQSANHACPAAYMRCSR